MHIRLFIGLLIAGSCAVAVGPSQDVIADREPTITIAGVDWFKTRPQSYQGPTATGTSAFLAQTNPAPFKGQHRYIPNNPLEMSEPILGADGRSIFHKMGPWSPYYLSEDSFGVDEYPCPVGSNITQMHLLHRHGSRYPSGEGLHRWAKKISEAVAKGVVFEGDLDFLNNWSSPLGQSILTARGRQELFDSGVVNYYNYGSLYSNKDTKIVARTTTQDRMLKSAESFLSGFFGPEWTSYANVLAMIESPGYNTSLAPSYACPNSKRSRGYARKALTHWKNKYLSERTSHLRHLTGGFHWTVKDTYSAQTLCAFETVAIGYSSFCKLFNYKEWEGFAYTHDISSNAYSGFQSPIGRAKGITWVEEFLARVEHRKWDYPAGATAANFTLNDQSITFPLNQSLYLDFSHDHTIVSVLTAFGFKQFSQFLPPNGPPKNQRYHTSQVVPFAGRLNIEIIEAPYKIKTDRCHEDPDPYIRSTARTDYVHFILNQRTLPLHRSFRKCEARSDGWCELETFLKIQKHSFDRAEFEYACRGQWGTGSLEYSDHIHDGVPPQSGKSSGIHECTSFVS
ncbi:putative acid phosphatase [Aspergillus nomiae NRRL 13137]|uniref:3-phytase n=1 Tax=Aspergillus nomiae NRRL (strain ATCC 15546 / NRRL 13137 / CBS 260.88 / M93) TaxID=1509407 RepID=A0A0L1JGG2_ASPN3|nr:putative acid phosphatase [Aspergillus nomiae NRRL 13137]KNG90870.1 putative acid phosphatase [Aspergillus nomiae NRRL 13137]